MDIVIDSKEFIEGVWYVRATITTPSGVSTAPFAFLLDETADDEDLKAAIAAGA